MQPRRRLIVALAAVGLLFFGHGTAQTASLLETPVPPGALLPNLYPESESSFLLSWVEDVDKGHALRVARYSGSAWEPTMTVSEGENWFVNWADFPSVVALDSSSLVAHWLQRSSDGHYTYDVRVALSSDAGRSWGGPIVPHSDSSPTEHGFVSLVPDGSRVAAFWLDGRQLARGQGAMGLWFASLTRDGRIVAEEQLDGRVCDCCQTAAVAIKDGLLVAYRDRSFDEVRDISVVRRIRGRWEEPRPVGADGWQIQACPVNGPALAGDGDREVVVAWYSSSADVPRVQMAHSNTAGATFSSPFRLDDGQPLGRVHIVRLGDDYAVSWIEEKGEQSEIRVRRVSSDGPRGPSRLVATIPSGRATGFPRMVPWADGVIVAWTEPPIETKGGVEPGGVELAAVRLIR